MKVKEMVSVFQKDHGETIGDFDFADEDIVRIPTGAFELDMAMGGGWPRGRVSIIYGPESSSKTNLALKSIVEHQRLWPDTQCVFIDVEHSYDAKWTRKLGVDTKKLLILKPSYAEQATDMLNSLLCGDDIGLIVLDSIAAMIATHEVESSAEKTIVAGNSIVVSRLIKKTTNSLLDAWKEGVKPSVLFVNQTRTKIGGYGLSEVQPGGNAQRFAAAMVVRVGGTDVKDERVSKTMPVLKHIRATIKKKKCPTTDANAEFDMVMIPHKGMAVGETKEWGTITAFLERYGLHGKLTGKKKGWFISDAGGEVHEFKTAKATKEFFYEDSDEALLMKEILIQKYSDEVNEPVEDE